MLRMEFTGHSVDAPLLSETARRFNVNNNIISAQMDYAGGVKFGIMLTEMHGTQEDTQAAHRLAAGTSCKSRGIGLCLRQ
ncbi:methionine ABC transporter ATP-binding protein [Klebsiella variicola]|uniref:Methionine ABC transporter ATP-binding protein n=1 Tax=Klebsiella variicola TaxID=244366 RepID=A0A7H4MDU2_KLEVA|nr:methionine ABC transporter ATP-binding protein [Klebsiella variicola]